MLLYIDPFSGISGDMFLGLLVDLGLDIEKLKEKLNELQINYNISIEKVNKKGIEATKANVQIIEEKSEKNINEINNVLEKIKDEDVRNKAKMMFDILVNAEGNVHGLPKEKIHLHELGDSLIDIVGAIYGLKLMRINRVLSALPRTGRGFVETQHGKYPVPAPATLEILKNTPLIFDSNVDKETVTPTGALLLKGFVEQFGDVSIRPEKTGYGAGKMDLEIPNVLRGILTEESEVEDIEVLETNVDNMNPEIYGYLMDRLFKMGALDVFYTPTYMKKNRPGVVVSVLCRSKDKEGLIEVLLNETTTLGVRAYSCERLEIKREVEVVDIGYGKVKIKVAQYGDRTKIAPEYESCREIAEKTGRPYVEVYEDAKRAWRENNV